MRVVILGVVFVLGCGSVGPAVTLTPAGSGVILTTSDAVESCTYLGDATANYGGNFAAWETNVDTATLDVRNQAGGAGATHLLIDPPIHIEPSCTNCVFLRAQLFDCNRPSTIATVVTDSGVEGCTFVTMVQATYGSNDESTPTNANLATARLRRLAISEGATHLIINPPAGEDCVGCVTMSGQAYDCSAVP